MVQKLAIQNKTSQPPVNTVQFFFFFLLSRQLIELSKSATTVIKIKQITRLMSGKSFLAGAGKCTNNKHNPSLV